MIPIALSVFLWDRVFKRKKIAFHVDNLAVVTVLNSKSSKSPRVMNLLRFIVYRSMMGHFHMKAFHISSANNCVADALSRGQFQNFKELAPEADTFPTAVPMEFWSLFKLDFVNLVENSLSENAWNVYANAEKSFEKFRKNYDLEKVWPVFTSNKLCLFGKKFLLAKYCQILYSSYWF